MIIFWKTIFTYAVKQWVTSYCNPWFLSWFLVFICSFLYCVISKIVHGYTFTNISTSSTLGALLGFSMFWCKGLLTYQIFPQFRKVTVSFRHTHPVPFKLKCQIYQNLMLITSDIKLGILMKIFFFHESVSINKCIN